MIAQGNLEHRVDWSSHDSFGIIAGELNRIAVRLRDLRDSEAGRKQMEFQLSDAVLQSIFEPIIVTDGKGHVLKVNQAAAEILGEAAGDRMALTTTPGGGKILSAIRDAVSMQKAVAAEGEAAMLPMRIGQQERSYRLRTTPMRDSDGRLLGTVTTLEDVTSLQDTDRFKTQFIAVASRKLRDPLLQLRRGLYALGQGFGGPLASLQSELVAAASNESEKLNELMTDLIDVAELDTGKRELHPDKLRPLPLLNEARDRFCETASAKRVRIEVSAFADLSFVQADRRAVRSIFDNLLSNAIRYTPPDGEILSCRRRDQKFRTVHRTRHRPRHRSRTVGQAFRSLQCILRYRNRPGPRARCGVSSNRSAARSPSRARLGHGTTFQLHPARGCRRNSPTSGRGGLSDGQKSSFARTTAGTSQGSASTSAPRPGGWARPITCSTTPR